MPENVLACSPKSSPCEEPSKTGGHDWTPEGIMSFGDNRYYRGDHSLTKRTNTTVLKCESVYNAQTY